MAKKKATTNSYLTWRRSFTGGLVFGAVYLLLAYIFVSLAIDSGSLWQYLLGIVSFIVGAHSAYQAVKSKVHEKK